MPLRLRGRRLHDASSLVAEISAGGSELRYILRLLALVFNRPEAIGSTSESPLPEAIDDEYLKQNGEFGCQPPDKVSRIQVFVHSIKLFDVVHDILATLYNTNKRHTTALIGKVAVQVWSGSWLEDIVQLDKALQALRESLPDQLRLGLSTTTQSPPRQCQDDWIRLQVNVFHSRYVDETRNRLIRLTDPRPDLF